MYFFDMPWCRQKHKARSWITKQINKIDSLSLESLFFTKVLNQRYNKEQFNLFLLSKLNYTRRKTFFSLLLLLSGDISLYPGPTKYPYAFCEKGVRKGIFCSQCHLWDHQKCEGVSNTEYRRLSKIPMENFSYTCSKCTVSKELPFYDIPMETFLESQEVLINDCPINNLNINQNIWSPFHKRGLHFLHININSILPKLEELRNISRLSNASIIGISESKLDETVLEGCMDDCMDGYKLVRADWNRNGGGVACYIKSDLAFN